METAASVVAQLNSCRCTTWWQAPACLRISSPLCIPPDIERNIYPGLRFQPAVANEWKGAALDLGVGLVVVLGVAGAWRIHNRKAP